MFIYLLHFRHQDEEGEGEILPDHKKIVSTKKEVF